MNKVLEFLKKNKKSLTILFLIILFGYYLIWVVKQPFNSCPDEGMKWDGFYNKEVPLHPKVRCM